MRVFRGEVLRDKITGELYEVKKFRFDKVLLVARELPDKGWFGDREVLGFQYEKVGYGNEFPHLFYESRNSFPLEEERGLLENF